MSTTFDIFGVVAPTGSKLIAALILPSGLATAASTTVNGGTVSGTTTVTTSSTVIYMGLSESPSGSGEYGGTATIAGTALPDTTNRPYTAEVRVVAGGTDMTSYSAIAAAFAASTSVAYTRDVPQTLSGGYLASGAWGVASVVGSVAGKILGGGSDTIAGIGTWSMDAFGRPLALNESVVEIVDGLPPSFGLLSIDSDGKVVTSNPAVQRNIVITQG